MALEALARGPSTADEAAAYSDVSPFVMADLLPPPVIR